MTTVVARVPASVTGLPGVRVLLDGRASEATDASAYRWAVLEPARGAQLSGADEAVAFFQATEPGLYSVKLTVADGDDRSSAIAVVEVPRVDTTIEGPAAGTVGEALAFDGGGAPHPPGTRYDWSVEPAEKTILQADGATVRFLPQRPDTYTVRLVLRLPAFDATAAVEAEIGSATRTVVVEPRREGVPVATDDDAWWAMKQLDDSRALLTTIAGSAARWQGMVATILGLFGAVAFVAGPTAVTDAPSPGVARLALALVVAAFGAALLAVVRLAGVAHRAPQVGAGVTAADYRQAHVDAARADLGQLREGQRLTVLAGVLVATGSLILSFGSIDAGDDPIDALVRTGDATLCGEIGVTEEGDLLVAGREVGPVDDVQIVTGCGE